MNADKIYPLAHAVLQTEADAILALKERIDEAFIQACVLMLDCKGRIVVIGMGKSGHVGSKIAATLASTGTPAFFVHPGEASHGDLGMLTPDDVVLTMSNSGETSELLVLLPIIKRLGVPMIAMTGNVSSSLAQNATVHLNIGVEKEACPLGLAPTASTTATLAMGDALAVSLLESRGFTADDFARSHPAGSLGKRLLLHISDVMHKNEKLPLVLQDASLREALLIMTEKRLGIALVIDDQRKLLGVFTDGDLRRALDNNINVHQTAISEVMIKDCQTISEEKLAVEAARMMEDHQISALPVLDEQGLLVGALNIHDLFSAGVL